MKRPLFFAGLVGAALALFGGQAKAATDSETPAVAPTEKSAAPAKVRYKQGDDINFENLLIEGQLQKPSVTVVTGSVQKGGDGLLRLRKNFLDRIARDFGEEAE